MENHTSWHELLKTERDRRSWTQEEVAAKLRVSPRTIRSWESGAKQPSPKLRRELSTLYNKSFEELGFIVEIKSNPCVDPHLQTALPPVIKEEQIGIVRGMSIRQYWLHPHSMRLALFAALLISFSILQWFFFVYRSNVSSQRLDPPNPSIALTAGNTPGATTPSHSTQNCSGASNGVTLYVSPNYQGYCHTFAVNANGQQYNLAQSDFAQKVGSLRDPRGAFHVVLMDQFKRPEYFESDIAQLPSRWQGQAHWLRVDRYPPTSCNRGSDGIVAYVGSDYQGGCLFITRGMFDVGQFGFDHTFSSLHFVGRYINNKKLVIYRQIDYQDPCGTYSQDQPDLGACGKLVASVLVLPYTPPTPTRT